MKNGFKCRCVDCGKGADHGSMKHPYCKECWERKWGTDSKIAYKKYWTWVHEYHNVDKPVIFPNNMRWIFNYFALLAMAILYWFTLASIGSYEVAISNMRSEIKILETRVSTLEYCRKWNIW